MTEQENITKGLQHNSSGHWRFCSMKILSWVECYTVMFETASKKKLQFYNPTVTIVWTLSFWDIGVGSGILVELRLGLELGARFAFFFFIWKLLPWNNKLAATFYFQYATQEVVLALSSNLPQKYFRFHGHFSTSKWHIFSSWTQLFSKSSKSTANAGHSTLKYLVEWLCLGQLHFRVTQYKHSVQNYLMFGKLN